MNTDTTFFYVCAALAVLTVFYDLFIENKAERTGETVGFSFTACLLITAVVMAAILYLSAYVMGYVEGGL